MMREADQDNKYMSKGSRRESRVLSLAYAVIFSVLRPLLSWLDLGLRLLPLLICLTHTNTHTHSLSIS